MCVCYDMNIRELDRLKKIEQVVNKLQLLKGEVTEDFITNTMISQEVSRRTAKEYIRIAEYKFKQLQNA